MNSSSDPIEIKNQTPNAIEKPQKTTKKPQKTTRRPSSVKFERSQYILALEELSRYDKHHPFPDSTIWERLLFHTPPKISGRYVESLHSTDIDPSCVHSQDEDDLFLYTNFIAENIGKAE
jgi:hypothetical protein